MRFLKSVNIYTYYISIFFELKDFYVIFDPASRIASGVLFYPPDTFFLEVDGSINLNPGHNLAFGGTFQFYCLVSYSVLLVSVLFGSILQWVHLDRGVFINQVRGEGWGQIRDFLDGWRSGGKGVGVWKCPNVIF